MTLPTCSALWRETLRGSFSTIRTTGSLRSVHIRMLFKQKKMFCIKPELIENNWMKTMNKILNSKASESIFTESLLKTLLFEEFSNQITVF